MASVTTCSDFGAQENKVCHCFHCFPIYLPWSDGTGCHDLRFLNVKSVFSLSSFTFTFFLRLLPLGWYHLLLAILIPACASSSLAFRMMYSACKLNKQGDNTQTWRTSFPIWNQSVIPYPVLSVASSPVYRCLKRQYRWSGIPISWRIFHSLLWFT